MNDRRVKVHTMLAQDPRWVFVRVMGQFWVRTDSCILFAPCPSCRAKVGELCQGHQGNMWTSVHWDRKRAATRVRRGER